MIERKSFYIGGEWMEVSDRELLTVVDPSTEQALAIVSAGTLADVNRAVAAAHGAFESWSSNNGMSTRGLVDPYTQPDSVRAK